MYSSQAAIQPIATVMRQEEDTCSPSVCFLASLWQQCPDGNQVTRTVVASSLNAASAQGKTTPLV